MAPLPNKPAYRKLGNTLDAIVSKIKAMEKVNVANAIGIGEQLEEAAKIIPHGEYGAWLADSFSWSSKTAYRYRAVFKLSENCHNDNFCTDIETGLNISITALYALAELPWGSAQCSTIIETARKERVTFAKVRTIIMLLTPEHAPRQKKKVVPSQDDVVPSKTPQTVTVYDVTPPPEPPRKITFQIEHGSIPLATKATIDAVKQAEQEEMVKPPAPALKPASSLQDTLDVVTGKTEAPKVSHDDLSRILRQLDIRLHDAGPEVVLAVADVGVGLVREIIGRLKKAADQHSAVLAAKEKANAAVARRTVTPPADDLGLPPFLDRRKATIDDNDDAAEWKAVSDSLYKPKPRLN